MTSTRPHLYLCIYNSGDEDDIMILILDCDLPNL